MCYYHHRHHSPKDYLSMSVYRESSLSLSLFALFASLFVHSLLLRVCCITEYNQRSEQIYTWTEFFAWESSQISYELKRLQCNLNCTVHFGREGGEWKNYIGSVSGCEWAFTVYSWNDDVAAVALAMAGCYTPQLKMFKTIYLTETSQSSLTIITIIINGWCTLGVEFSGVSVAYMLVGLCCIRIWTYVFESLDKNCTLTYTWRHMNVHYTRTCSTPSHINEMIFHSPSPCLTFRIPFCAPTNELYREIMFVALSHIGSHLAFYAICGCWIWNRQKAKWFFRFSLPLFITLIPF